MKKAIYISLLALICTLQAASQPGKVTISDQQLPCVDNKVYVQFMLDVDKHATASNRTLILTPVFTDGGNGRIAMKPIYVEGRRAHYAARRERVTHGLASPDVIYTGNGSKVEYKAVIDYAPWLDGSKLVFQRSLAGCCKAKAYPDDVMIARVKTDKLVEIAKIPEKPVVVPVQPAVVSVTTGDRMSQSHNWVSPMAAYPSNDRTSAMIVYFNQSKKTIDRNYRDNAATLDELLSVIRTIDLSDDSRITKVLICGYASPEGSMALNKEIAQARAEALQAYVRDNTRLMWDKFELVNGNEDWDGLRRMVAASTMQYRDEVLRIIDTVPVWDARRNVGREGELMRLHGGDPYRYMMKNFFPELRNACYLKVYYQNK